MEIGVYKGKEAPRFPEHQKPPIECFEIHPCQAREPMPKGMRQAKRILSAVSPSLPTT